MWFFTLSSLQLPQLYRCRWFQVIIFWWSAIYPYKVTPVQSQNFPVWNPGLILLEEMHALLHSHSLIFQNTVFCHPITSLYSDKFWKEVCVLSTFSSVQSLSSVQLFVTPWTTARQASLSITNFPEFRQTHVHRVSDAIQPTHPLSSPSPPAPNPSQHQSLFQWVSSSHQVDKGLEFQLQHQSFQWTPRTDVL